MYSAVMAKTVSIEQQQKTQKCDAGHKNVMRVTEM